MSSPQYDFIFTGGGAAALSLAMRIKHSAVLRDKRILLIDHSEKTANDRTWSFWEKGEGFFESILFATWAGLDFVGTGSRQPLDIAPYRYKMIRGIDFYTYCQQTLRQMGGVHFRRGHVDAVTCRNEEVQIVIDGEELDAGRTVVFNSLFASEPRDSRELYLLQHFKGWVIETDEPAFDPSRATLMDFSVEQSHGTTFAYVLPFSERSALVEYTLFTESLLEAEAYEAGLQSYLDRILQGKPYRVVEKEFGIIPMTDRSFAFHQQGVYHIGTAGGRTKASTGYTFQFIQKQSEAIVQALEKNIPLQSLRFHAGRFRLYDGILLSILANGYPPGKAVFCRLFQRNKASRIFRFLDNESSVAQDLQLISTLPFTPFLKAAWKRYMMRR